MDMEPFSRINPCGYAGLKVTELRALVGEVDKTAVARRLAEHIADVFEMKLQYANDSAPQAAIADAFLILIGALLGHERQQQQNSKQSTPTQRREGRAHPD